jgi:hypothetical protein
MGFWGIFFRSAFMMLLWGSRTISVGGGLHTELKSILRERKKKARMRKIGNPGLLALDG